MKKCLLYESCIPWPSSLWQRHKNLHCEKSPLPRKFLEENAKNMDTNHTKQLTLNFDVYSWLNLSKSILSWWLYKNQYLIRRAEPKSKWISNTFLDKLLSIASQLPWSLKKKINSIAYVNNLWISTYIYDNNEPVESRQSCILKENSSNLICLYLPLQHFVWENPFWD